MSMHLTFTVGKDKRSLVNDIQDFHLDDKDTNNPQWLQARQFDDGMRQVFVTVKNEDGSPFNLVGCNFWFEGILPDELHKILDAKHGVPIDLQNGKFRFDMPKQAFTVAGSYQQAFFRIVRNGDSIALLEFDLEVLADLVISNLEPADYITPFEDLYNKLQEFIDKSQGGFKAAMIEWQSEITRLITDGNLDLDRLTNRMSTAEELLKALEDQIKQDGLVTQKDFEVFKDQFTDLLSEQIEVDEDVDIGESLPESLQAQLDIFKSKIPKNAFNVAIISDSHYDDRLGRDTGNVRGDIYKKAEDSFKHETAFNYLSDAVDVMIANGDDTNGFNSIIDRTHRELSAYTDKILTGITTADRYCLLGNHDDGSGYLGTNSTPETVISNDELKKMFKSKKLINGEKRDEDSLYFYKDYPDAKIRLIGLNSLDDPDTLTDDGKIKYIKWLVHNYSQRQINWLANIALKNIPTGFQVVVVAHTPLIMDIETISYDAFNHRIVRSLLEAVADGTPCKVSSDPDTPVDLRVNVDVDYTQQGPRPIAGFIVGHVHSEKVWNWPRFTMTSVTCDVNNDPTVLADDPKSMALTIYSFDVINKKVNLFGFGRATNRSYLY